MSAGALDRRAFLAHAAAAGFAAAWAGAAMAAGPNNARERRDLYPQGVASGDPDENSVLLWTRRPFGDRRAATLHAEVSPDADFATLVARASAPVSATSDWTCRVLVGNLEPGRTYWYRFVDQAGNASRIGRTRTAPDPDDNRGAVFAFCCCQNLNLGTNNAYRRMIHEDLAADARDQIAFVLHLGDFVYELIWYHEDRPQGYSGRALRDVLRYPKGEQIDDFHVPADLDDYRALYRAYLADPDLQDARARWPFIAIWDNHEFSWNGWQGIARFGGIDHPAQRLKVAANQAWFEYQPARVRKAGGDTLDAFNAPPVANAPVERFDAHGFGDEPNNRAAVASLTAYRALRWGRHVELILTDQRSYRSSDPFGLAAAAKLASPDFPLMLPEGALRALDAGSAGERPATLVGADGPITNFRRDAPPQTLLGVEQKAWFLDRMTQSRATWKLWGNSLGTLPYRCDPQNLPPGAASRPWPGNDHAVLQPGDFATAWHERRGLYDALAHSGVSGFVTLSGDRHSFWAGLASAELPPEPFAPVGVAFVVGGISSPGLVEKLEQEVDRPHPLGGMFCSRGPDGTLHPVVNLLLRHGVRAALDYAEHFDGERARCLSNPALAPHLKFLDLGGQGYGIVRTGANVLACDFICIARPLAPSTAPDGGPLVYRMRHEVPLWKPGAPPRLKGTLVEGSAPLSV